MRSRRSCPLSTASWAPSSATSARRSRWASSQRRSGRRTRRNMRALGIDTSNYTTSAAVFDGSGGYNAGRLLEVRGYPSCDGEPCANVSDETDEATDTLADGEPAAEADAAKALEEAVAQWQDKYVRLQAEFDNYRKRTLKEKMDLVQTGGRDVLLEMLPVRDDVQRAVDAMQKSDDLEALRAGVTLISQKFTEALRRKGVTEIEVLDKEFDADFSEAVARFAAGDEKKGKVIDVVQTGYMLGEKVLRFAKVVVGE